MKENKITKPFEQEEQVIDDIAEYTADDTEQNKGVDSKEDKTEEMLEESLEFEEAISKMGNYSKVTFSTGDVAQILGITSQTLRNYCAFFKDHLNIPTTENGHRRYNAESIDQLKKIIAIKEKNHFTVEETKQFLDGNKEPDDFISYEVDNPDAMQKFLNAIDSIIDEKMEESYQKYTTTLTSAMQMFLNKHDEIQNQNRLLLEEKSKAEEQQKKELQFTIDKMQLELERLKKENESLQEEIQKSKKKKFPFFGK